MNRQLIFLTHAEVEIDPAVAVTDWGLSETGRARHASFAQTDIVQRVTGLYTSAERKAREGVNPLAARLGLNARALHALGENDRSATGFLPPEEFERTADAFFANPDDSIRGWERARAAQARVVASLRTIADLDTTTGDLLIVAHGAVGALLRCWLKGIEITRAEDQPAGGGCYFITDPGLSVPPDDWQRI
ncbi:histidine phosphatase family protein [uncultured Roseobacter sp.]|uniref:histidine phosphatase family protein n=1 Tax=uncultured Roseobacter sp. TaxID=114847 RepID=UPI002610CC17|nr:histidine phosphatase family protein [uncultured Roseobacter sp.]